MIKCRQVPKARLVIRTTQTSEPSCGVREKSGTEHGFVHDPPHRRSNRIALLLAGARKIHRARLALVAQHSVRLTKSEICTLMSPSHRPAGEREGK
jgi:hypothetical protein